MKRRQFEQHARDFRAGQIDLNQLIDFVYRDGEEIAIVPSAPAVNVTAKAASASDAKDISVPALNPRPSMLTKETSVAFY